jgi:hypothetical protein
VAHRRIGILGLIGHAVVGCDKRIRDGVPALNEQALGADETERPLRRCLQGLALHLFRVRRTVTQEPDRQSLGEVSLHVGDRFVHTAASHKLQGDCARCVVLELSLDDLHRVDVDRDPADHIVRGFVGRATRSDIDDRGDDDRGSVLGGFSHGVVVLGLKRRLAKSDRLEEGNVGAVVDIEPGGIDVRAARASDNSDRGRNHDDRPAMASDDRHDRPFSLSEGPSWGLPRRPVMTSQQN